VHFVGLFLSSAGIHLIGQKACGRSLFIKLFSATTQQINIKYKYKIG